MPFPAFLSSLRPEEVHVSAPMPQALLLFVRCRGVERDHGPTGPAAMIFTMTLQSWPVLRLGDAAPYAGSFHVPNANAILSKCT